MKIQKSILVSVLFTCYSCVDEIALVSESEIDTALVIEAVITNEMKRQRVELSRAYDLEDEGPSPEINASVELNSSNGEVYSFQEIAPGIYESTVPFMALPNTNYELNITTVGGVTYGSSPEQLTPESPINDLFVERGLDENGTEGVSIFLNTDSGLQSNLNFRYEYEETYKIIAPLYSPLELVILNDDFDYPPNFFAGNTVQEIIDFFFLLQPREEQEQICYNTVASNEIIIASSTELESNGLDRFRVRFVGRDNYIISHRYSLLVRQFVQSLGAHEYYKTLSEFSESESIFSENQVGFLQGNVFSRTDEDEKVIGYFQVSSVTEERVYFNYADLFPGEQLPPYYTTCDDFFTPILLKEDFFHNIIGSPVIDDLKFGFQFYDLTGDTNPDPFSVMPFELVLEPCGDCTVLGENSVPDFWVE